MKCSTVLTLLHRSAGNIEALRLCLEQDTTGVHSKCQERTSKSPLTIDIYIRGTLGVLGQNDLCNICMTNQYRLIEPLFKRNRKTFPCLHSIIYINTRGVRRIRDSYHELCKPSTSSRVCITVQNSPITFIK